MATQPVDARRIERLLTGFEKRLNASEARTIRTLVKGLLAGQNRLLTQLQPAYGFVLDGTRDSPRAIREARARELLRQVQQLLAIIPTSAQGDLQALISDAADSGIESATSLIRLYEPELVASFAVLPREALLAAAQNSYQRLLAHGEAFAARTSEAIVSGISTGSSWRKVAGEVKAATGITRREAERIVATESAQAHDEGHRATYQANGVEYVQRVATLDQRTCPYCAARAGNVYRLEDAQAVLHAHDRCRLIPWKPEWQAAGLSDDEWMREHKRGVIQKLREQGQNPSYGLAPFEKAAGMKEPPKPFWTP